MSLEPCFPEVVPAPGNFLPKNHRKGRYRGDDLCLPLVALTEPDQAFLRDIYQRLEGLFAVLKRQQLDPSSSAEARAQTHIARIDVDELLGWVQALGKRSLASCPSELMSKTLHDLRGGAMNALLGHLQLTRLAPPDTLGLRQLFFLTRDHLKIMRNALLGLDDPKREADLETKLHSVDLIAEKWQHALIWGTDRSVQLEVDCAYHGNIAECCVEFGALDRVLYNLVNNACRHTASSEVKLSIHNCSESADQPDDLRFVVSNAVTAADRHHLQARGDLRSLFQPGVSSTGSGFGLTVAMDFVANAYGLLRREDALRDDYLGARLTAENQFEIWFYWPVAADV